MSEKKIGRNDPCPCGSGKKYKNCCLGKTEEPKKVYTTGGKRKFKAKVIDSSLESHGMFAQSAGGIPTAAGNPDALNKLRFRSPDHDYRVSPTEIPSASTTEPIEQPSSTHQPIQLPQGDFQATTDDFRIEKKSKDLL